MSIQNNIYKVCFWLNAPSHYQRDFLKALYNTGECQLEVRYFSTWTKERFQQKWEIPDFERFEQQVDKASDIRKIVNYQDYLHVFSGIGYEFNKELLKIFLDEKLKWMHWSEPYGINVYKIVHYNNFLSKLIMPIANIRLRRYAQIINSHSIAVLGQGSMARNNFISWGVDKNKIEDLYYCGNEPIIKQTPLNLKFQSKVKHTFINIGQLSYRKGIDLLLKAFNKLQNADNWGLILVGMDSFDGYIQRFLKNNENCSKRICVLPPISPKEIGDYINQGDVFVLPSRYDGWGIVLNEAAGIGKPLIGSTMAGASWHVINENINGLRFKSGSIKELTKAMQYFVNNPTKINDMGKSSKKIFLEKFSAYQNAKRFLNILFKYEKC